MAVLNNSNAISPSGYDINNSLRIRSSAYLSRTMSASGTTATFSFWVKRGTLGVEQAIFLWSNGSTTSYGIEFNANDTLTFLSYSSAFVLNLTPAQVFRDPSAWYHIVCVQDTTQATASNRAKLYVNGTQVTAFSTATYPAQNTSLNIASSNAYNIGRSGGTGALPFDGYFAEWNFIDGSAKVASDFGEIDATTGVWKPKKYTGTYGTNGFYLNFSSIATTSGSNAGLGKDFSGNTNYWTTNNISVTSGTTYDAMKDSPTNTSATVANYCVLNPLIVPKVASPAVATINEGNLAVYNSGASNWLAVGSTVGVSSGKWYWEVTPVGTLNGVAIGIHKSDTYFGSAIVGYSGDPDGYAYLENGNKVNNSTGTAYGATFASGDVIGVALDMDAGTLTYYKNNTSQGTAFIGLSRSFMPASSVAQSCTLYHNFGQRPFQYSAPSGFLPLNTFNLP